MSEALTLLAVVVLTALIVGRVAVIMTTKRIIRLLGENPNSRPYFKKALQAYNAPDLLGKRLNDRGHATVIDNTGPADSGVIALRELTEPKEAVETPLTQEEQKWVELEDDEFLEELDKEKV